MGEGGVTYDCCPTTAAVVLRGVYDSTGNKTQSTLKSLLFLAGRILNSACFVCAVLDWNSEEWWLKTSSSRVRAKQTARLQ